MAAQLEVSASSVREPMAAVQRSASSLKESSVPILQRVSSVLKGSPPPAQLRALPSMSHKDLAQNKFGSAAIRNRNIIIGVLSTFLFLAIVSWPWHGSVGPVFIAAGVGDQLGGAHADPFHSKWSSASRAHPYQHYVTSSLLGASKFLYNPPAVLMPYHNGPVLTGKAGVLKVYLIYYGSFTSTQKSIFADFLSSFAAKPQKGVPTVASWWAITKGFTNSKKIPVAQTVIPGSVFEDANYSKGKSLQQSTVLSLVEEALQKGLTSDPDGLYVVLTSADVQVQGFCSSQCGTHLYTFPGQIKSQTTVLPYAWAGNPATQCPGFCAWPYAKPAPGTGPNVPALKAPNGGDVGINGMIINIATLIVGAATNPFANAYFQGDASDPLEAAGVCGGIYGAGAYPGYAGNLLVDKKTGASFNVHGVNGREFLVPWIYNPGSKQCAGEL